MKNKFLHTLILVFVAIICATTWVEAKGTVVGDLILLGNVQRSGLRLANDSSVFEGDSIHTDKASAGVLRIGTGRFEMGESSEMEIVTQSPLKIVVKSGTIAFNVPKDTPLEIVTPQLEIHANAGSANLSAVVNATPGMEDRFQSRSGDFTVIERQPNGKANHLMPGQIIVATLLRAVAVSNAGVDPIAPPQGPLVGAAIAVLQTASGDVRAARSATPNNFARVMQGLQLGTGDFVRTLNGRAIIQFPSDLSQITLTEGTTIQVQQQMQAGTLTRRITQAIGSIWFNITRTAGTQTTLETPTAVAAIRGTQGEQDVPNDTQSTHALNEGVEQITEVITQQSVTIRSGQRVTAIRGVGFTPIVALLAAITQPIVGAGGAGGGGGAAGGGAGGAAGGAAAGGAAAGAATASTVTTVAAVSASAVAAGTGVIAAVVPTVARKQPSASESAPSPLNPPGGG